MCIAVQRRRAGFVSGRQGAESFVSVADHSRVLLQVHARAAGWRSLLRMASPLETLDLLSRPSLVPAMWGRHAHGASGSQTPEHSTGVVPRPLVRQEALLILESVRLPRAGKADALALLGAGVENCAAPFGVQAMVGPRPLRACVRAVGWGLAEGVLARAVGVEAMRITALVVRHFVLAASLDR